MLSVSCACFMSLHHRTDGKSLSHMQSPAMVWFLKFWMSRFAALERWLCGSTSCILMPSSSRYDLTTFVATSSIMLQQKQLNHTLKMKALRCNSSNHITTAPMQQSGPYKPSRTTPLQDSARVTNIFHMSCGATHKRGTRYTQHVTHLVRTPTTLRLPCARGPPRF